MNSLILADTVFSKLFESGYVDTFQWKDLHFQTSSYLVTFSCKKCVCESLHTFQILVIDGKHYIPKSSVELFIRIHKLKGIL